MGPGKDTPPSALKHSKMWRAPWWLCVCSRSRVRTCVSVPYGRDKDCPLSCCSSGVYVLAGPVKCVWFLCVHNPASELSQFILGGFAGILFSDAGKGTLSLISLPSSAPFKSRQANIWKDRYLKAVLCVCPSPQWVGVWPHMPHLCIPPMSGEVEEASW